MSLLLCSHKYHTQPDSIISFLVDGNEYFCEKCSKKFPTLKGYKIHQNAHDNDKQYTCELCPKTFSLPNRLRSHIDKMHSERMYECSICLKTFETIEKMKTHRDKHTSDSNHYPCNSCQKSFKSATNLGRHLLKCTKEGIGNFMEVSALPVSLAESHAINLSESTLPTT